MTRNLRFIFLGMKSTMCFVTNPKTYQTDRMFQRSFGIYTDEKIERRND